MIGFRSESNISVRKDQITVGIGWVQNPVAWPPLASPLDILNIGPWNYGEIHYLHHW